MKKSVEDMTTDLAELSVIQGRGASPSTGLAGSLAEVLAGVVHVERVPVDAHFFDDLGADSLVMAQFCARVRKRDDLPSVSMKDIYQHPTISRLAAAQPAAPPTAPPRSPRGGPSPTCWPASCGAERVSVDSHFFDDLGADSLVMAHFCARVRKRADLPSVSMKDIYQHPTIRQPRGGARRPAAPALRAVPVRARRRRLRRGRPMPPGSAARRRERARPARRRVRPLRGAAAPGLPRVLLPRRAGHVVQVYEWISAALRRARRLPAVGRRPAARSSSACAPCRSWPSGCSSVGGSPRQLRVWSLAYVRFWVVKTLVQRNPLVLLFVGLAALLALPEGAGREGRPGRRDPLPERAGVHRPAHHRRRHRHPQGRPSSTATGPTPA